MNRRPILFHYGIRFQEDGRIETFPAAEVSILNKRGEGIRAVLYIDSGATTSILPAGDAEVLNINLPYGHKMAVKAAFGETVYGYRHDVTVQFENEKLKIPVIFVEYASVPRILGREGVFTKFAVLFDEARRRTVLLNQKNIKKEINNLF